MPPPLTKTKLTRCTHPGRGFGKVRHLPPTAKTGSSRVLSPPGRLVGLRVVTQGSQGLGTTLFLVRHLCRFSLLCGWC